jgi:hypothetical protein
MRNPYFSYDSPVSDLEGFLFDHLSLLQISLTAHWWPIILIIVGLWLLLRHKSGGKT